MTFLSEEPINLKSYAREFAPMKSWAEWESSVISYWNMYCPLDIAKCLHPKSFFNHHRFALPSECRKFHNVIYHVLCITLGRGTCKPLIYFIYGSAVLHVMEECQLSLLMSFLTHAPERWATVATKKSSCHFHLIKLQQFWSFKYFSAPTSNGPKTCFIFTVHYSIWIKFPSPTKISKFGTNPAIAYPYFAIFIIISLSVFLFHFLSCKQPT